MTSSEPVARFDAHLAEATSPHGAYEALQRLAADTVGCKLFTVMLVDLEAMIARRAFTSHPVEYPASGAKPVTMNAWFETVGRRREIFVANDLAAIADVFPDAELIGRLGCASVVNLPIFRNEALAATVNLLHEAGHYTPARVDVCRETLTGPATRAVLTAERLAPASAF